MAFFDDFLKALATGDSIKDYSHASRIFRDDGYNLAPKSSFLYYVLFKFNGAVRSQTDFSADQGRTYEIGVLVKNIQLPSFQLALQEKNQYGKHTYTQTRVNYNPVQITFHDDMANTINEFWANYYRYYYADANKDRFSFNPLTDTESNKYTPNYDTNKYGYKGFDQNGASVQPFLESIKIYSLHKKEFTEYTLVKPMIETMTHGTHDAASSAAMEAQMTLRYQSVLYGKGSVANGSPEGMFLHYDTSPSPIANSTSSVFGQGGLVDTINDIITDLGNGDLINAGIKILQSKDVYEGQIGKILKEEGVNIISDVVRGTTGNIVPTAVTGSSRNIDTTVSTVNSGRSNINVDGQNG